MENKSLIVQDPNLTNDLINFHSKELPRFLEDPRKIFDSLDISNESIKDYKYRIGLFLNWHQGKEWENDILVEYKKYLRTLISYSVPTKNHYFITASRFLKELARRGILTRDIATGIKTFKEPKTLIGEMTKEEMTKIFNALKELPDTKKNTRLKAMIFLMSEQGLRQVEISRLDLEDFDFENRIMMIWGKGREGKEPCPFLQPKTIYELKKYIQTNGIKSGAMFFCLSNIKLNERLTTRGIRKIVQEFLKGLGISRNLHSFRHFYCGQISDSKELNMFQKMEMTRHNDAKTLLGYIDRKRIKEGIPAMYKCFSGFGIR